MHLHKNGVGDQWVNEDPLTISATQLRVSRLLEAALCSTSPHQQSCKCTAIRSYYGPRLFKCNRFGCPFFRTGFESATDRERHLHIHDRPYRCDRLRCEFSQIGFSSEARLKIHLKYHEEKKQSYLDHQAKTDNHDDEEPLLLDAVKADNPAAVRSYISELPEFAQQVRFAEQLIRQAVQSASYETLELLLEACDGLQMNDLCILQWAVEADNLEAMQILLDRGASVNEAKDRDSCIYYAIRNKSPEMIEILLQYDSTESSVTLRAFEYRIADMIPLQSQPHLDAKVIKCLGLLKNWTAKKDVFEVCFMRNAARGCSIPIARCLLQSGVDVNTRKSATANTALYKASQNKGQSAAELMRFLLESGADPSLKLTRSTDIADRPGPRNIAKWLGISWEQLVEESGRVYAESLPSANSI